MHLKVKKSNKILINDVSSLKKELDDWQSNYYKMKENRDKWKSDYYYMEGRRDRWYNKYNGLVSEWNYHINNRYCYKTKQYCNTCCY